LKSGRKCIENNKEKLELLNCFQKLIFGQRSAAPLKVPAGARDPQTHPLATSLYSSHPHQHFLNLCAVSPSSTGEKTFSIAFSFISIGARL